MITLKDANGNYAVFDEAVLSKALSDGVGTIYGMNMACCAEIYDLYKLKGGSEPITPESIREAFK